MSIALDERLEQRLYDAIQEVSRIPRPKERERIFRQAADGIMRIMSWDKLEIKDDAQN